MEMKFKINEQSHLIVTDDKKEITFMTDKSDLKEIVKIINDYLNKSERDEEIHAYGYNPRTKRLEPIIK